MSPKKKAIIGVSVFLTVAAIVGLAVGLYFHFSPSSTHLMTVVSSTTDGTVHLSTKFQYKETKMVGENVDETFTIMFAGLNSSQIQKRMLQTAFN